MGDGLEGSAGANAAALIAMREYCETNFKNTGVSILLPRGEIMYDNNRWFPFCDHVEIIGYGTTLRNVLSSATSAAAGASYPIYYGDMWRDRPVSHLLNAPNATTTCNIATANAGDNTITLLDINDASNFSVGMRVFIGGKSRQYNSGPPALDVFEWNEVESISGSDNEILTLKYRLRNTYPATWREDIAAANYGKHGPASVLPLERPNFHYPRSITLKGMRFGINPNHSYHALFLTGERVLVENVTTDWSVWPGQAEYWEARNCDFRYADEIEKCVETVVFDGCRVRGNYSPTWRWSIGAASSTQSLTVRNCVLGEGIRANARQFVIEDNVIQKFDTSNAAGLFSTQSTGGYVRQLTFRRNRISAQAATGVVENYIINNAPESVTALTSTAGSFTVDGTEHHDNNVGAVPRALVHSDDWQDRARVHDLTWDGTNWVIHHDTNVTFPTGVALKFYRLQWIVAEDNEVQRGGHLIEADAHFSLNQGPTFERRKAWRYRGRPHANLTTTRTGMTYTGYASKMTYRVLKASAAAPQHQLNLYDGTNTLRTLFNGRTTTDGSSIEVDFALAAAGDSSAVTYNGTWTNTVALAAAVAQPILRFDAHFCQAAGGGTPGYSGIGDTPLFEFEFEGAAAIV